MLTRAMPMCAFTKSAHTFLTMRRGQIDLCPKFVVGHTVSCATQSNHMLSDNDHFPTTVYETHNQYVALSHMAQSLLVELPICPTFLNCPKWHRSLPPSHVDASTGKSRHCVHTQLWHICRAGHHHHQQQLGANNPTQSRTGRHTHTPGRTRPDSHPSCTRILSHPI
jgi:hypothetical protein